MHSIALPTPSSCHKRRQHEPGLTGSEERTLRIASPASFARAICFSSVTAVVIAAARLSTVMLRTAEPMPRVATRSA